MKKKKKIFEVLKFDIYKSINSLYPSRVHSGLRLIITRRYSNEEMDARRMARAKNLIDTDINRVYRSGKRIKLENTSSKKWTINYFRFLCTTKNEYFKFLKYKMLYLAEKSYGSIIRKYLKIWKKKLKKSSSKNRMKFLRFLRSYAYFRRF